jgi:hypothetical protein
MGRTIEDLNQIASVKLGKSVVFTESVVFTKEELQVFLDEVPPYDKMLVHTADLGEGEYVSLVTTDFPHYNPWCLIALNPEGSKDIEIYFD